MVIRGLVFGEEDLRKDTLVGRTWGRHFTTVGRGQLVLLIENRGDTVNGGRWKIMIINLHVEKR